MFKCCSKIKIISQVFSDDIQIRFFEEQDGVIVWEGFGEFEPSEVYKGVAIAFRPPRYRLENIDQPITCYVQLVRPSTKEKSEPLPFQFTPTIKQYNILQNKKRKLNPFLNQNVNNYTVGNYIEKS